MNKKLHDLRQELLEIDTEFNGNRSKDQVGEKYPHTINKRIQVAYMGIRNSSYGPTPTHKRSLEIAQDEFKLINDKLTLIINEKIPEIEKEMKELGAPWVVGQEIPE